MERKKKISWSRHFAQRNKENTINFQQALAEHALRKSLKISSRQKQDSINILDSVTSVYSQEFFLKYYKLAIVYVQ